MTDLYVFFAEHGAEGIAYSDSMNLYELEKYLIDKRGFIILRLDATYVHFYDPSKVEELQSQQEGADLQEEKE